jgi:hypothetical protein
MIFFLTLLHHGNFRRPKDTDSIPYVRIPSPTSGTGSRPSRSGLPTFGSGPPYPNHFPYLRIRFHKCTFSPPVPEAVSNIDSLIFDYKNRLIIINHDSILRLSISLFVLVLGNNNAEKGLRPFFNEFTATDSF